jgi:zinc protease
VIRMLRIFVAILLLALPVQAGEPIQEVTSPGGIRAWLIEDHGIPFMALEIRFRGGANLDPAGKRGAASLMASLIEEGTGDMDAQAFARARDALAAELSFEAGTDAISVSARFLTENRDQAADLLRQALTAPRFDPDAVERVRGQLLSIIASNDQDPSELAGRRFDAVAHGDHPYGSHPDGTAETVAGLTRDDLVAIHKATIARDRIYVGAAGDITPDELGRLLDELFAGLPATGAPQPPMAGWLAPGDVQTVDFPSPQSLVLFGQKGLARLDPDFFPAFVLNEMLGGGRFSARLMTEVREKRGLTYGIGTSLVPLDLSAYWIGQFSSDNGKVAEAIQVVRDEWARAARGEFTEAELGATKTYMIGSYPLRWNGNGPLAQILVGMQMQGMPIDYAERRNDLVAAVTLEDIRRVAAQYLTPETLQFVVVGRPEGLAATAP